MSETPRPTPPHQAQQAPTPRQPAPTPAALNADVPVEAWRTRLAEAKEAPAAERHERLGALLDDLDTQVGSL